MGSGPHFICGQRFFCSRVWVIVGQAFDEVEVEVGVVMARGLGFARVAGRRLLRWEGGLVGNGSGVGK